MKYESGSAFRRALEDRLRAMSLQMDIPLVRLRKMVAFDRFLSRLFSCGPDQWVVKGGFALQLRLGGKARTTKDIDLLVLAEMQEIYPHLREVGAIDSGDWFTFEVSNADRSKADEVGGLRYGLHALLDSRTFEQFHIDIGIGDPLLEPVEYLETPALLAFAGIEPTVVPCYPISQQIAEKFHAFTRLHRSGESSRVKDFVDMLLLAEMGELDSESLRQAIQATFDERQTHALPAMVPSPPRNWSHTFQRLASEVGLAFTTLAEGERALGQFLNPVLGSSAKKRWLPNHWDWG